MKHLCLVLALFGLAAVASAYEVRRDPCAWGPTYWCKSTTNAQQCRQVHYCRQNFWKSPLKTSVSVEQPLCDVCKFVATYLDQFVDKNSTEAEAKALAKDLCNSLPSDKEECELLVDSFFDDIWKELEAELEPDVICAALRLCNSSAVAVSGAATAKSASLKFLQSQLKTSVSVKQSLCDLCEFVVTYLDKYVDNSTTEERAKDLVEQLCTLLGQYSNECKTLVEENFDMIWKMLEQELKPAVVCTELGLCNSSAVAINSVAMAKTASLKSLLKASVSVKQSECDLCKFVATFLDQYVNKSSTEAEAKALAHKLCSYLGEYAGQCGSAVDAYFPLIWKYVENELEPDVICAELGVCNATIKATFLKGEKECDDCTKVVDVIGAVVNSSMTEEVAKKVVEEACDFLGPVAPECKMIVDLFFNKIWELLGKELTPQEICEQLRLCSRNASRTFVALPKAPFALKCSLCEYFMGKVVKDFLNTSTAQAKITSLIDEACDLLPTDKDQQECQTFINSLFPELWKLFINDLMTPDNVCSLLGACGNETKVVARRRSSSLLRRTLAKGGDARCDLCKEVETELKNFIDSANETAVKDEVEKLCKDLPDDIATQCSDAVDNYFDILWDVVKSYLDNPEQFCELIGLCNSTAKLLPTKTALTSEVECELCQFLVKEVDQVLTRNATEAEVLALLGKACNLLPSSYADTCSEFVQVYGPTLYQRLVTEAGDPSTFCSLIKLCTPTSSFKSDIECELCEDALEVVKSLLPKATDKVVTYLTDLCGLMPSALRSECTDFVKEYGPDLIPLIAGLIDPDKDCQMVDLCPKMSVPKMRRR